LGVKGKNGKIATDRNNGEDGKCRRNADFVEHWAAEHTRSAAELTQNRREYRKLLPLRELSICTAGVRETPAGNATILKIFTTEDGARKIKAYLGTASIQSNGGKGRQRCCWRNPLPQRWGEQSAAARTAK